MNRSDKGNSCLVSDHLSTLLFHPIQLMTLLSKLQPLSLILVFVFHSSYSSSITHYLIPSNLSRPSSSPFISSYFLSLVLFFVLQYHRTLHMGNFNNTNSSLPLFFFCRYVSLLYASHFFTLSY